MSEPIHFVTMSEEEFLKEALAIVEKGQARGICLRILGSLAIYVHSLDKPDCINAIKTLGRFGEGKPTFTDLDLVTYRKQSKDVAKLFQELKFKPNTGINWWFGDRMLVYNHPENKYHVDLFLNSLVYSHDVCFGEKPGSGRLELDYPTITLEDIVLEKLQTHQINRKDVIDLIVLFMGHDIGEQTSKDVVDGGYIARILSNDWGFWYDATTNLDKMKALLLEFTDSGKLSEEHGHTVKERTDKVRRLVDNAPKTQNWEKRARTGTSKPWYREVEELAQ